MKNLAIQVFLLIFCGFVHGQQAFTNYGNLQIHTGASVAAFGNFTNNSSGVLINNANLYIKGNISNDQSSMSAGTGTLNMDGSTAQSVNGTQPYKTWNLNTNNTNGLTLNNNLSVSGAHTFTTGIITTSATPNYLMYEAGSSYSGDGDSRHVNGWVKKFGSTNFIFPVGNGTVERTVALNSLSVNSEFNAKYFASTPNTSQMQIPVRQVDNVEYWSINKVSGGSASVTMNWDYSKAYFPNWIVSDILATGYNGSLWTDNGGVGTASGNPATTGTVTSSSISSFNLFTFGNRSWILPLTLISFDAVRQGNYTQITWATEREYNVDRFIVERSDDGISFYAISQIPARNGLVSQQYNTKDIAPINRIAYYRLRMIDADNRGSLSKTVAVTVSSENRLTVLTNPVHDKVTLVASPSLNGLFNYTITAMNGKLMQRGKLTIQNGGQYQLILKGDLSAGIYTLDVFNHFERFRYKLSIR